MFSKKVHNLFSNSDNINSSKQCLLCTGNIFRFSTVFPKHFLLTNLINFSIHQNVLTHNESWKSDNVKLQAL